MDIDIDISPNTKIGEIFNWTRASLVKNETLQPHPCGYYPQNIAVDAYTNLAAIPYAEAENAGYFKLDFLHLHFYQNFSSRHEIDRLLQLPPDWGLLQLPSVQEKLFQLAKHGDLLVEVAPRDVDELADVMALIRPGKKVLLGLYKKDKINTRKLLYAPDENGFAFKRAHSYAYAMVVVLQLHLFEMGKL